jgi:hypothetical protein
MALSNPGIPGIVGLVYPGQTVLGGRLLLGIAPSARAVGADLAGLAASGYLSPQRAG